MSEEVWDHIPGYKYEYGVSTYGRLMDLSNGNYLNTKNGNGYIRPALNGVKKYGHRVVAEVFIPNPDNKPCVNHKDSNRSNNHVDNLEWCTRKENQQHGVDFGNMPYGESCSWSKLTSIDVLYIRWWYNKGYTQVSLAKCYSVSSSTIGEIVNYKIWKQTGDIA